MSSLLEFSGYGVALIGIWFHVIFPSVTAEYMPLVALLGFVGGVWVCKGIEDS